MWNLSRLSPSVAEQWRWRCARKDGLGGILSPRSSGIPGASFRPDSHSLGPGNSRRLLPEQCASGQSSRGHAGDCGWQDSTSVGELRLVADIVTCSFTSRTHKGLTATESGRTVVFHSRTLGCAPSVSTSFSKGNSPSSIFTRRLRASRAMEPKPEAVEKNVVNGR